MLNLAEELLLLALEDEEGKPSGAASGSLECGLAGAVLMELALADRISLDSGNVVVADASPVGERVLDRALAKIADSSKARTAEHWICGGLDSVALKYTLLDGLVEKGIIAREERKVLWIIPTQRYPERDGRPEQELRERIRAVVLEGQRPEPRLAAVIVLVKACDLTDEVFSREERKQARQRLEEISDEEAIDGAVSGAVAQTQTAMQAAVMVSVTAATASASASCAGAAGAGGAAGC